MTQNAERLAMRSVRSAVWSILAEAEDDRTGKWSQVGVVVIEARRRVADRRGACTASPRRALDWLHERGEVEFRGRPDLVRIDPVALAASRAKRAAHWDAKVR